MSLLHELTRTARQPAAPSPLPEVEPVAAAAFAPVPPAPLTTIEITKHHPSGGFLATFAGDKAIGATPLEALGQLVVNGAFGQIYIANRT